MCDKENLVISFKDSIFDPRYEIAQDWLQFGVDNILNANGIQTIPVISTIAGFCKFGYNLYERHLIKELVKFLNAFNSKTISKEKLKEHRKKLEENPEEMEKELSRILIVLNQNIEEMQSECLGKFYRAYTNESIDWDVFSELSNVIMRMSCNDIKLLLYYYGGFELDAEFHRDVRYQKLVSLGLVREDTELTMTDIPEKKLGVYRPAVVNRRYIYELTDLGKKIQRELSR